MSESDKAARFPVIPKEQMTDSQKNLYNAVTSSQIGTFHGPYIPLLYNPELTDRSRQLGEYLRFNNSLPPRLSELAILITARVWASKFEWVAHRKHAVKAGLAESIIEDLLQNKRPECMQQEEEITYDFCTALLNTHFVDDALFAQAVGVFELKGVVDLVGLCGYYTFISMILNVGEIPIPPGAESPW